MTHFKFSILGEFKPLVFPRNPVAAEKGSTQETRTRNEETWKTKGRTSNQELRKKTNSLAFTFRSSRCGIRRRGRYCVYKVSDQTTRFDPVQSVN